MRIKRIIDRLSLKHGLHCSWKSLNTPGILKCSYQSHGRRVGLMVSGLVSRLSSLGSSLSLRHCVVFLGQHFALTVPLSSQVYKWVMANLMLGVNPAMV